MQRYEIVVSDNGYDLIDNVPSPLIIDSFEDAKEAYQMLTLYNTTSANQFVTEYTLDFGLYYSSVYFSSDIEARDWFYKYFVALNYLPNVDSTEITLCKKESIIAYIKKKGGKI